MDSKSAFNLGLISSVAYFQISESTVPKDSNCSYLAPVSTDVLAILAGAILAMRGNQSNDPYISFIGACILGIHTQQWYSHKRKVKEKNSN
jgi:hypothetical protein